MVYTGLQNSSIPAVDLKMGQYETTYSTEYRHSWALAVGIDQYKDGSLPPLSTGVKGARAVAATLRDDFGFDAENIILLENEAATQRAIRRALTDPLSRAEKVGPDDRVIVYFAGHGVTFDMAQGEVGCIAPYDIESGFIDTTIPMDELTRLANRIHAKHVLFLLDCCFSGFATLRDASEGVQRQVDDFMRLPARQVITAGTRDQRALDGWGPDGHALFTGFLLEGLRGAAPAPGGVLRAFHLAGYIQDMVGQHVRSIQTPQYASLIGSHGGDFVFNVRDIVTLPVWLLETADSKDTTQRLMVVGELRMLARSDDADIVDQALAKLTGIAGGDPDTLVRSSAQAVLSELMPETIITPVEREELVLSESEISIVSNDVPDTHESGWLPIESEGPEPRSDTFQTESNLDAARGARLDEANHVAHLGDKHKRIAEYREAKAKYEEALSIYRIVGNRFGEANCLKSLGDVHLVMSDVGEAKERYEVALSIYRAIGSYRGEANCLTSLSNVCQRMDKIGEARNRYETALSIYRTTDDRLGEANCLKGLGDVSLSLSELVEAHKLYKAALSTYRAVDARIGEANCLEALGDLHMHLSELIEAREIYKKALLIYHETSEPHGEANCISSLGDVHRRMAEYEEAKENYDKALSIYRAIDDRLGEANCLQSLGDVSHREGHIKQASLFFQRALNLYRTIDSLRNEAVMKGMFARLHMDRGEIREAIELIWEALQYFEAHHLIRDVKVARSMVHDFVGHSENFMFLWQEVTEQPIPEWLQSASQDQ